MYVYFPSIVSDVGVKGTITPCDVHFAARFCLQLSAPLFEACFPPPPPTFLYLLLFFKTLSFSNEGCYVPSFFVFSQKGFGNKN